MVERDRAGSSPEDLTGPAWTTPAPATAHAPTVPSAPRSTFAHDFRLALAARHSSLRGLSLALTERGVQVSTPLLAAWRAGTVTPAGPAELAAVRVLEELLALPADHLARWVDPQATPRRPGGRRPEVGGGPAVDAAPSAPADVDVVGGSGAARDARIAAAVQRARTALGFERSGLLVERSVDLVLELDARGVERRITQVTEWVARVDGVDSFPSVLVTAAPVRGRAVVEPVSDCRLGPTYADLAEGVFAAALVLPRPLRLGESVTTVHRTHLPEDASPETVHEHRLLHRVERVSVGVVFDADRGPAAWQGFSRTDEEERAGEVVAQDGVARVARDDFGPGGRGAALDLVTRTLRSLGRPW